MKNLLDPRFVSRWKITVSAIIFAANTFPLAAATQPVTVCAEPSLRAAVKQGGTIQFGCDGVMNLAQSLVITNDTVLDGNGHSVTLSGGNSVRVLLVQTNIHLSLIGLTVANGRANQGAGVFNGGGTVQVTGCVFSNNIAMGANGADGTDAGPCSPGPGLFPDMSQCPPGGPGEPGGDATGGGIYNTGTMTLTNVLMVQNQAVGGQGGRGGTGSEVSWEVTIFYGPPGVSGHGGSGFGAAVFHRSGELRIVNSQFFSTTDANGVLQVEDPNTTSDSARFYRFIIR